MSRTASIKSAVTKLASLAFAAGAVFAASIYPLDGILLAAILLPYAALLTWRPVLWLLLVPALVPLLDIAPWTGWFYLEEIDLLLLVTAAVGYWRLGAVERSARLPTVVAWSLALLTIAYLIGTVVGLGKPPVIDANSFANYYSRFNSLRVAKGFFWMLVLLPLLLRSAGPELGNIRRYFVPGMLIGLAGVCAAAIWERIVFTGLLNLSSDYRITAPFSAMHTGGAALDGYLALALPFVAAWLLIERSRLKMALGMALLVVGMYVGLVTFSRGVYLAYGCAALVFIGVACLRGLREGSLGSGKLAGALLAVLAVAFALLQVFTTSGYRGLGASIALLLAAFIVSALDVRLRQVVVPLVIAAGLCGLSLLSSIYLGSGGYLSIFKGVYAVFALSVLGFGLGAAMMLLDTGKTRSIGLLLCVSAFVWMAFNTVLVAQHWAGNKALGDITLLVGVALAMVVVNRVAVNRVASERLWTINGSSLRFAFICSVAFGMVLPMSGSYFMAERFSTVKGDLDYRWSHWTEALDMMTPDIATSAFGMGIGRYPDTYYWKNHEREVPSTFRYEKEAGGNLFLRLGVPQYSRGYGEVIRMLQRVSLTPNTTYAFSFDARGGEKPPAVSVAVCERLLLYPQNCVGVPIKFAASGTTWQHYQVEFNSRNLGGGDWLFRPPVQLEMSVSDGKFSDIDNVSLIDRRTAIDVIRNGSFSNANEGWFFSSDRHHLPWHVKNFALNIFFELGWLGVLGFVLLLSAVMLRLVGESVRGSTTAAIYLAAMLGFFAVGLFDSLLDVPRLAFVFFLIVSVATLKPVDRTSGAQRRRRRHRKDATPGASASPGAATIVAQAQSNLPTE